MLTVMRIDRWDPRRDGPLTELALRQKVQACGYEVSSFSWPAGTVVPAQAQDRERVEAVLAGIVRITLDGESAILTAGDMVFVPRGAMRQVEVVGCSPAQWLNALYQN